MRYAALVVAGTLLTASPVLAQEAGNVGQPSRVVPQAGQTSGGPIDTAPGAGGAASTGSVSRPIGEPGLSPGAGAIDSAKGGNATQTNQPVPNTGTTSGGPAR